MTRNHSKLEKKLSVKKIITNIYKFLKKMTEKKKKKSWH